MPNPVPARYRDSKVSGTASKCTALPDGGWEVIDVDRDQPPESSKR